MVNAVHAVYECVVKRNYCSYSLAKSAGLLLVTEVFENGHFISKASDPSSLWCLTVVHSHRHLKSENRFLKVLTFNVNYLQVMG